MGCQHCLSRNQLRMITRTISTSLMPQQLVGNLFLKPCVLQVAFWCGCCIVCQQAHCRCCLEICFLKFGPIKQSPPLSVAQVTRLDELAASSPAVQDRLLAGSLLVLLYSRCSFGDGHPCSSTDAVFSMSGETEGFIEFAVQQHKTASTFRRKRQLLPAYCKFEDCKAMY